MENCHEFDERASSFLEKEMPEDERRSFQSHLNDCERCRMQIRRLESLRLHLKKLPSVQTRPDFESVLRARIQMSKNIGRRSWRFDFGRFRGVPAYGFSLAAIVLLIFALRSSDLAKQTSALPQPKFSEHMIEATPSFQSGDFVFTLDVVEAPHESAEQASPAKKSEGEKHSMIVVVTPNRTDSIKAGKTAPVQTETTGLATSQVLSF